MLCCAVLPSLSVSVSAVQTMLKMIFEDNFVHGDMHPGKQASKRTSCMDILAVY